MIAPSAPYRKAATTTPSSAAAESGRITRHDAPISPATPASARSTGTGPIEICGAYDGYPAGHAKYFLKRALC